MRYSQVLGHFLALVARVVRNGRDTAAVDLGPNLSHGGGLKLYTLIILPACQIIQRDTKYLLVLGCVFPLQSATEKGCSISSVDAH